ncbi:MAG TPA: right-handed parallel beta-helix repeat-containing protein, partial [Polyangia bacterium]
CDKVERDWSKCNITNPCKDGYTCLENRCVSADAGVDGTAGTDASDGRVEVPLAAEVGAPEAAAREVSGAETVAAPDAPAALDALVLVDAEEPVDAPLVAADVPADMGQTDVTADTGPDTQVADAQGSCGTDLDCPVGAPLCIDFTCVKCRDNADCTGRADASTSGLVCDPQSGACVVCAKHSDCTDSRNPICKANQCVPCQSATSPDNDCRSKNPTAPVCKPASGTCVACLTDNTCGGPGDGGVDGGDGGADGGVVGGFCNVTTNRCVGCLEHKNCKDPNKPICGGGQTCVACGNSLAPVNGCSSKDPALPVCKALTGNCVRCTESANCLSTGDGGVGDGGAAGKVCSAVNTCVECNTKDDCTASPAKGFCAANACVGCQAAGAGACTGATPVCATGGGKFDQCVECMANTDCKTPTAPICNANNQCVGCKKDTDCSARAGVCGLDGSCPGTDSVIYVQNSAGCSTLNKGSGTFASPFCYADDAAAALTPTKSIILVTGTVGSQAAMTVNLPGTQVLISGKSAPTTAIVTPPPAGTPPVVAITGGEVTLRDLTITTGQSAGVSVAGATLHMDRCYVLNNAGNGILTANSAFDIINTVIANNGGTTSSGVTLGSYSGSGPTRFAFNTVVNNGPIGVICGRAYTLTGILANGNVATNFSICTTTYSSEAAPALGTNYHLTASSPCVNAAGASCPADDIDGEARPNGAACDCGADEF